MKGFVKIKKTKWVLTVAFTEHLWKNSLLGARADFGRVFDDEYGVS